jgi:hypothetical protein
MAQYWELKILKLLPIYSRNRGKRCLFANFFSTLSTPLFLPSPLIGKGVDLFAVKDWLGHQDIKPTME